jgi:hypothetical protein
LNEDAFLTPHWLSETRKPRRVCPELFGGGAARPTSFRSLAFCPPLSRPCLPRRNEMHCDIDSIRYVCPSSKTAHADKPLLPRPTAWTTASDGLHSRLDPTARASHQKSHWASFLLGSIALSPSNFPNENPESHPLGPRSRPPIRVSYLEDDSDVSVRDLEFSVLLQAHCDR